MNSSSRKERPEKAQAAPLCTQYTSPAAQTDSRARVSRVRQQRRRRAHGNTSGFPGSSIQRHRTPQGMDREIEYSPWPVVSYMGKNSALHRETGPCGNGTGERKEKKKGCDKLNMFEPSSRGARLSHTSNSADSTGPVNRLYFLKILLSILFK